MPDQPIRPRFTALGADHGHLTRPAVGAGDEPAPPRPHTAGGVLFLAVVAVLVALLIQLAPTTERGQASTTDRGQGVSLCEEHPHWSVCQEEASSDGR